jgi:hypothetical protein
VPDLAPEALLATRYGRDFDRAVVFVVISWHTLGAGAQLWSLLSDYAQPVQQVAAWAVLSLIIVVGAVRLLAGNDRDTYAIPLATAVLAVNWFVSVTAPQDRLLETDWAWGTTGWACVLLLLRRPLVESLLFLAADATVVGMVLASGGISRTEAASFVTVLYASASIQLAVVVAARVLDGTARRAVQLTVARADADAKRLIAERVHAARQDRYRAIGADTRSLLAALAEGRASPEDAAVRTASAVAAARLRRLFAESDDVPDPLVHELRACADIAERRAVRVDIEAIGRLPEVPGATRRAFGEAAIDVLARARSHARITLSAEDDGVAVAIVADVVDRAPPAAGAGIAVSHQYDENGIWVEARWPVR